jgi:hypothetical protein
MHRTGTWPYKYKCLPWVSRINSYNRLKHEDKQNNTIYTGITTAVRKSWMDEKITYTPDPNNSFNLEDDLINEVQTTRKDAVVE